MADRHDLRVRRMTSARWSVIDRRIDTLIERGVRGRRVDSDFADALRVIAASTRTGASLAQSLGRAASRTGGIVGSACARAAARIELGQPVETEVNRMATAIATPAAHLFAHVV